MSPMAVQDTMAERRWREASSALAQRPECRRAAAAAAEAAIASGRVLEAIRIWEELLAGEPNEATILTGLARAYRASGNPGAARDCLERAVALPEPRADSWVALAQLCGAERDDRGVRRALDEAVRRGRGQMSIWLAGGELLLASGWGDWALQWTTAALRAHPKSGPLLELWARLQEQAGRPKEALEAAEQALRTGYVSARVHALRGYALLRLNQRSEALRAYMEASRLDPRNPAILSNLGGLALDLGFTTPAISCFDQVLALSPGNQPALVNKAKALRERGRAAESIPWLLRGLRHGPDPVDEEASEVGPCDPAWSNYLYSLLFCPGRTGQEIADEHRRWGERLQAISPVYDWSGWRPPEGRIRVGYLSPDLRQHSVASFMDGILRYHDSRACEVIIYSCGGQADEVTRRLRGWGHRWKEVAGMKDEALAAEIRQDRLDILVELSGHTAMNRLPVCARKPAPIIVTYLGYPATTGLRTIDYRLTDELSDPIGQNEGLHTERLFRLPGGAWCFSPPMLGSEGGAPEARHRERPFTFGCFNHSAKWNEPLATLWLEILRQAPGSRLYLKSRPLLDEGVCKEWVQWFAQRGVTPDRLILGRPQSDIRDHLKEYQQVDVALDTYPYHGTTTSCEALWSGVPLVTLAGETHASRVGCSLLAGVSMEDLIAADEAGYVRLAVELASSPLRLAEARNRLREKRPSARWLDGPGFTRSLENAFLQMVRSGPNRGEAPSP